MSPKKGKNRIVMKWEKVHFPWGWMKRSEGITSEEYQRREQLFHSIVDYFGFDTMAYENSDIQSFERFLSGKRSYNNVAGSIYYLHGWRKPDRVPDRDHPIILKTKGTNNIVYINQPYDFKLKELETWCNERNLIYVLCDKSWSFYYPDNTEIILIMSSDTYVNYVKNIQDFPWRLEEKSK